MQAGWQGRHGAGLERLVGRPGWAGRRPQGLPLPLPLALAPAPICRCRWPPIPPAMRPPSWPQVGSVIRNPEVAKLVPVLLAAIADPAASNKQCLDTLLATVFVNTGGWVGGWRLEGGVWGPGAGGRRGEASCALPRQELGAAGAGREAPAGPCTVSTAGGGRYQPPLAPCTHDHHPARSFPAPTLPARPCLQWTPPPWPSSSPWCTAA